MPRSKCFGIGLGAGQDGLTLRAKIVDSDGVDIGSEIAIGFVEIGNGFYLLTTSVPDSWFGGIKFYTSTDSTVLAFLGVDPEDGELLTKIESRTPAALVGGKVDANIGSIGGNSAAATSLKNMLANTGNGTTLYADIQGIVKGGNVGLLHGVTEGDGMQLSYVDEVGMVDDVLEIPSVVADVQSGMDLQGYTQERAANLDYLDANVSGIIPSIGNMIADVITAISSIAATVWSYPERTITFTLARLLQYLAGVDVSLRRGDDITCPITVTNIEGWQKLWVTLKTNLQDPDSDAVLQFILTNPGDDNDGIQVLNGVELEDKSGGWIEVTSNLSIILHLSAAHSSDIHPKKDMLLDVQAKIGGKISTVAERKAEVTGDVTRAIE